MEPTKLLYMEDMDQLECEAQVVSIEEKDGKTVVVLDQTVMYPQGGGQPYDTGTISHGKSTFKVAEVRFDAGKVLHMGEFEGTSLKPGERVTVTVDSDRRQLHRRLHSAGHVLDMAVNSLGYEWVPGKGYHFPDGPYVEYDGQLDPEKREQTARDIEAKIKEILAQGLVTTIKFVSHDELSKLVRHVPEYLPTDKPLRVVMYGDFAVPCGGTHVAALKDIGQINISKIKVKDGMIRVSYRIG